MNSTFKKIASVIKKTKSIAIFTHVSADIDALGSSLSLANAINSLNKNVKVFLNDKFTYSQSLIFSQDFVDFGDCDKSQFDLMISTDVPNSQRLGKYEKVFVDFPKKIVLDHHENMNIKSDYFFADSNKSSCCEIVFEVLKAMKVKIVPEMANYLFAGLSSDTGSFLNSNINANSFKVALELVKLNANVDKVNEYLYKEKTKKEILFTQYLWNNFEIKKDCAYCTVDYDTLLSMKGNKDDCVNFSRLLLAIEKIKFAFGLVEFKKGVFCLSMRGLAGCDVFTPAKNLGGGGHLCASGATFEAKDIKTATSMVLNELYKK